MVASSCVRNGATEHRRGSRVLPVKAGASPAFPVFHPKPPLEEALHAQNNHGRRGREYAGSDQRHGASDEPAGRVCPGRNNASPGCNNTGPGSNNAGPGSNDASSKRNNAGPGHESYRNGTGEGTRPDRQYRGSR